MVFSQPPLIYSQDFESENSINDFLLSTRNAWQWSQEDGNGYLWLKEANLYRPKFAAPKSIAVLNKYIVKDFILELDIVQIPLPHDCRGKNCIICKHRDVCIFWGIQDSTHFYYAHIGATPDIVSHQIHIVNDAPRVAITKNRSGGVDWEEKKWNHVRVVHKEGKTQIYYNDIKEPVLTSYDTLFSEGYIGFGSFDEMAKIDNLKLKANEFIKSKTNLFNNN